MFFRRFNPNPVIDARPRYRVACSLTLKDFKPYPDYAALRDSSCAGVDDVGVLKKGTTVKFTGFCVRRYYWGPQPFVYGEVMSGEFEGKTFYAGELVQTASTYEGRKAWMEDVDPEAVRPLLAGSPAVAPVKTD
jgi:hypothetical protein